jgi:hypothetical protein
MKNSKTALLVLGVLLSATSYSNKMFSSIGNASETEKCLSIADMKLPFNMPEVKLPKFKADTLNIVNFGAVANSNILCTKAINDAIQSCSKSGGGVVVIPSGMWTTGPIQMKSNVNLHTKNGAYILFTSDLEQYKLIHSILRAIKLFDANPLLWGLI